MANTDAVWHSQFCAMQKRCEQQQTSITLHNVLMAQGGNCVSTASYAVAGEQLTLDQFTNFRPVAGYTGAQSHYEQHPDRGDESWQGLTMVSCAKATAAAAPYTRRLPEALIISCPIRIRLRATTNINATLLSAIETKTTMPPLVLSNPTANTTLFPQALPDSSSPPDLGYHYEILDYAWSNLTVSSGISLTPSNGVSVAIWGTNGITVSGTFTSQGTPLFLNHLVRARRCRSSP